MAGYSGTPLWKKLGVRAASSLVLLGADAQWTVRDLPEGVAVRRPKRPPAASGKADGGLVVVSFHCRLAGLRRALPGLGRAIFPDGGLWIAWPRRAAGHESDIHESDIRELALALGLVDVKVAALDEDWSGLRLVWRRERRASLPR